ncbi:non-ribosomal peptide synthetase [Polyangium jinanense]|uniref:Amino acid adenylation domain-containing protein n=1 Tax=Polyangium jinanense TaxID=2829994 RepID=A0A9X4ATG8_9BACT|nr:non-ribosomal peptide synthetase [Polyangium jinanense]MDC3982192.1 amino acid adenylation domain-containing protein [Polyangium jinanense]
MHIQSWAIAFELNRPGLIVGRNDTAAETNHAAGVHELFEACVARSPDSIAVVFGSERLSYSELDGRANALAHHLRSLGVGPGDLVGLYVERSLEMVVGLLSILKAGGVYMPLDPAYPAERLSFMLADAQVDVLLTQPNLASRLPLRSARVVFLEPARATASESPKTSRGAPSDLAYLIYTSGTTGEPKGVMVTRGSLSYYARTLASTLGITTEDRYLHTASIAFSSSVRQFLLPLVCGATLVIATSDQRRSPRELWAAVERHGVTVMDLVPSHWRSLNFVLSEVDPATRTRLVAPHLRLVLSASEALSSDVARAFRALAGPRVELVNMFGHTETTGIVATHRITDEDMHARGVPLGKPLPGATVHVLDADLQPLPVGVEGEVYVGGPGVARGYLNRPELTRGRFLPDPFREEPEARLYRTGDLGRILPDGDLEYLGRIDHQVKIRGFRVELTEIESVLGLHPSVRACVAAAREDVPGDPRVVAYVVPVEGPPATHSLREHLRAKLPEYMVPSAIVLLSALPMTPHGKVDRKALPPPADEDVLRPRAYVAPVTKTEQRLARLWAEVLGIDRVGLHDDVFDLGAHSLSATRVASRIASILGIEIPLRALFEARTLEAQARLVDAAGDATGSDPIARADRSTRLPLSFAQQRLWFLDRLSPGSARYNIPMALRLGRTLDVKALQAALDWLVARHEILRTTLREDEAGPFACIAAVGEVALSVESAPDEQALHARIAEHAQRPFDLSSGPMLRATSYSLGDDDHVLLLEVHHVAFDGWSTNIVMRELAHAYTAFSTGRAPTLPAPKIDYVDFAVWQRRWLTGDALERRLSYWRENLAGAPTLELPTDHPRPAVSSGRGAWLPVQFDGALSAGIDALARTTAVTPFMLLLAAFAAVLSRHAGQDDVVIGSPIANRNREDLEDLIGFFVNTLALRVDLSGNPTIEDLLRRVRRATLDGYTHQDVPFETVVDALHVPRDASRTPLFQVMFVLQGATVDAPSMGELSVEPWPVERRSARFDLTLSLERAPDGYRGGIEYSVDLFECSTVRRLASHLQRCLASIVDAPASRVSDLDLLTPDERRTLLVEWNDAAARAPHAASVHELFETWVAKTPDAVAVEHEDEAVSYAELHTRALRLAHHLQSLGVDRETLVGLCLPPSIERIVSVLGILAAGGAYLPLDPSYPPERLAFMLNDAGPPIVLTDDRSRARLAGYRGQTVCLPVESCEIATARAEKLSTQARPRDLAYVIYTSGSTGKPKGVLVEHRGLTNAIEAAIRMFEVTPADRVLQLASLSFDVSNLEIWMALAAGATLCLGAGEDLAPGEPLQRFLARRRITILSLTPSALGALPVAHLPALRLLNLGGETCAPELARAWRRQGRRIVNSYGPTEATIWSTAMSIRDPHEPTLIGRPIPNTQVYILDKHAQLSPMGTPGELCVGGAGVARGYLNRPALTEERFVPNPFGEGKLYRTGDRARHREDGTLEFLGRFDRQVKIRGFRVELGEIEAALLTHTGLREAAVLVREDKPGDARLVAYVVPSAPERAWSDEALEAGKELRRHLEARLPDFMVPSAIVLLSALPLGPNGKLDVEALPAPSREDRGPSNALVAPRSPTEAAIADIWRGVLCLSAVGVHDDFFALGGHSLLATQVIARIRVTLGVNLSLRSLFDEPTVAGMAARIEALELARALEPSRTTPHSGQEEISL